MTTLKEKLFSFKTDEEVYSYVKEFLLEQGEKSENVKYGCAYRGEDNRKCAIGCLILDEFYDEAFEGGLPNSNDGPKGYMVRNAIEKSLPNWEINYGLLMDIQEVHDSYEVYSWPYELSRRYEKYQEFTQLRRTYDNI